MKELIAFNNLHSHNKELIWIIKPGSETNRGFGIQVVKGFKSVLKIVDKSLVYNLKNKRTGTSVKIESDGWIVQLYLEKPLLVSGRKFDIRCFVLLISNKENGIIAYFFEDAYVRTSSKKYCLDQLHDRGIINE